MTNAGAGSPLKRNSEDRRFKITLVIIAVIALFLLWGEHRIHLPVVADAADPGDVPGVALDVFTIIDQ